MLYTFLDIIPKAFGAQHWAPVSDVIKQIFVNLVQ